MAGRRTAPRVSARKRRNPGERASAGCRLRWKETAQTDGELRFGEEVSNRTERLTGSGSTDDGCVVRAVQARRSSIAWPLTPEFGVPLEAGLVPCKCQSDVHA